MSGRDGLHIPDRARLDAEGRKPAAAPKLKFEPVDLPPVNHARRAMMADRYAVQLAAVKSRPGKWYSLIDYTGCHKSAASAAAAALRKQVPGLEAVTRGAVVYIRWPVSA